MRIVTRDQDVAGFAAQTVAHPVRGIARLQVARCRKLGERVAGAPERFGRLLRPKLAAVPDDSGLDAPRGDSSGKPFNVLPSPQRQGPLRIDLRADGVAMMDEKKVHEGILVGGSGLGARGS